MSALRSLTLLLLAWGCAGAQATLVDKACSTAETWEFSEDLARDFSEEEQTKFQESFRAFEPPLVGYAEAVALNRRLPALANYWAARSLWKAHLTTAAAARFNAALETPPTQRELPFSLAALTCLEKMSEAHGVSLFTDRALKNLSLYFKPGLVSSEAKPGLWRAAVHALLRELKGKPDKKEIHAKLKWFAGAGRYEEFALAVVAVAEGKPEMAEKGLAALTEATDLPTDLLAHRNALRLILARVLYAKEKYAEAGRVLKTVEPKSRYYVPALELAAWAALAEEKLNEAVTTSIRLFAGPYADDFAPEASGVAAVAFKEACQYSYARRTNDTFKQNYPNTHRWLRENTSPLYPLMAAHQRGQKIVVPNRIVREWRRSESYARYHNAITQAYEEATRLPKAIAEAEETVGAKAAEIAVIANTTDESLLDAASELLQPPSASGEATRDLASKSAEVVELKNTALRYERLTAALPLWKVEIEESEEPLLKRREELVARAEKSLRELKDRMLAQIEEASKNVDFIEAEIMSETSYEILRRSALPEALTPIKLERLKKELERTKVSLANQCPKKFVAPERPLRSRQDP